MRCVSGVMSKVCVRGAIIMDERVWRLGWRVQRLRDCTSARFEYRKE